MEYKITYKQRHALSVSQYTMSYLKYSNITKTLDTEIFALQRSFRHFIYASAVDFNNGFPFLLT